MAVLICCYNQKEFIDDCLRSLRAQDYGALQIYFLDNKSTDGSADYVAAQFPECNLLRLEENLGFAAANNAGMRRAFADGVECCVLLNTDTACGPEMISELVDSYERQRARSDRVGLVQATVLLFDRRDRVNTTGNALHYLGYGFCRDYMQPYRPASEDRAIVSASGAAVLASRQYFEQVGGFDEEFFIYNEDQNWSWRGLLMGFGHSVSAQAVVYHKYVFRTHAFKMYHSEKNRLMMLLENYAAWSLFVLGPILIVNEAMLLVHALGEGWFGAKLRSYAGVLREWKTISRKRRAVQATRVICDAEIFAKMEAELVFHAYQSPLIRSLVSPLMRAYHGFAKRLI